MFKTGLPEFILGIAFTLLERGIWGNTPMSKMIYLVLGGVLIGIGIVRFVYGQFLNLTYDNSGDLPGLEKELRRVHEAWALWRIGTHLRVSQELKLPQWKRVILIDPGGDLIKILARDDKRPLSVLVDNIRETTREYLELNGEREIRWYNGIISETMIIANPNSRLRAWIRLESGLPIPGGFGRSQRYIYRLFHPRLYKTLHDYYNAIWDNTDCTRKPDIKTQPVP